MSKHESMGDAVAAAMKLVERLTKDKRNDYAEYDYASSEAFIEMARGALRENGIFILQGMTGHQMTEKHLVADFEIYVCWGSEKIGPIHQQAAAPNKMGPQAFGTAGTYSIKNFLRAFLLMTSDVEEETEIDARGPEPLVDPNAVAPRITARVEKKLRAAVEATAKKIGDPDLMAKLMEAHKIETLGELPRDFENGILSRLRDKEAGHARMADGDAQTETSNAEFAKELVGDDAGQLLKGLAILKPDAQPAFVNSMLREMADSPNADPSVAQCMAAGGPG